MFEIRKTPIPGCLEIIPKIHSDARGTLIKTIHRGTFLNLGLPTDFQEQFYSTSGEGVLRGLHFQRPPHDHSKLVYCTEGEIFDAVVDLRVGSPTFGLHCATVISAENGVMLYAPPGLAHGFCVLGKRATIVYNVTTCHASEFDDGILWNSAGIDWPVKMPVLSKRDAALCPLDRFRSPFVFSPDAS